MYKFRKNNKNTVFSRFFSILNNIKTVENFIHFYFETNLFKTRFSTNYLFTLLIRKHLLKLNIYLAFNNLLTIRIFIKLIFRYSYFLFF